MQLYLLNEQQQVFPPNLCIDFFEKGIAVFGTISQGINAFCGEYVISIEDNQIVQDLKSFQDYIVRNHYHYSSEWTMQFLEEQRVQCAV